MNFFKKLFKNKEESSDAKKIKTLNIDDLLHMENTNAAIIELDNHISELCNYGENLENLNDPQKNFFLNQNFEREINNGGFSQFYYNSSGDYAT